MSAGSRADHDRFCLEEEWQPVKNARGKPVGHHVTYKLRLFDGRLLRTRISRPVDKTKYGPSLWNHILSGQLEVSEDEFWACVTNGVKPRRGDDEAPLPTNALPAWMVAQLLTQGVPEDQVKQMNAGAGQARLAELWSRQRG